jgi:hypothetical protein
MTKYKLECIWSNGKRTVPKLRTKTQFSVLTLGNRNGANPSNRPSTVSRAKDAHVN